MIGENYWEEYKRKSNSIRERIAGRSKVCWKGKLYWRRKNLLARFFWAISQTLLQIQSISPDVNLLTPRSNPKLFIYSPVWTHSKFFHLILPHLRHLWFFVKDRQMFPLVSLELLTENFWSQMLFITMQQKLVIFSKPPPLLQDLQKQQHPPLTYLLLWSLTLPSSQTMQKPFNLLSLLNKHKYSAQIPQP